MSLKNVRLQSGHFSELGGDVVEKDGYFEKDAMLVYTGDFKAMDGDVTITPDHIRNLAANHNSYLSKFKRLATGEVPAKAMPPIQLDHSPSATMTVGRLTGELRAGKFLDDDGIEKDALFGRVRVLGKENVEKVKDGRWTHLSIGADLDLCVLNELTITPFPAAPNASLLSKGKEGDPPMYKKLMAFLTGVNKLSEKDAEEKLKKMSDEEKEKLAAEADEAEKKMAAEEEESKKKLAAEEEEKAKKLAAEEEEKKKLAAESEEKDKKMSAARTNIVKMRGDMRTKFAETQLAAKTMKLTARLSTLRASAKLTPAEQKKIDLKELAGKSDEAVELFFKGFAEREPVIPLGQFGTKKAASLARLTQQAKRTELTAETVGNMPFLKKALESQGRLSEGTVIEIEPASTHEKEQGLSHGDYMKKFMEKHEELMNKGDREGLSKHLKEHCDHMAALGSAVDEEMPVHENHEKQMSGLAESVDKLQNDFNAFVTLASEALDVKEE